jgi:hypothetical protein
MSHFQAITFKDEIYVLGAFTGGFPHETPIPHIYIFNPVKNEWRKGSEIPRTGGEVRLVHLSSIIKYM